MKESRVCPICNRLLSEEAQAARFRPFCSRRCGEVDLGRWLKGAYAVPAAELDDETETQTMPQEEDGPEPGRGASGPVRRGRTRH